MKDSTYYKGIRLLTGLIFFLPLVILLCTMVGSTRKPITDTTIMLLRLDRVLTAVIVGAGLAGSGVVLQTVLLNPLAEPYILGISSGSALGAAVAFIFGFAFLTSFALPFCAFLGGVVTLFIVILLSWQKESMKGYSIILSGVVTGAILSSFLLFLVSIYSDRMPHVIWWMLGNLEVHSTKVLISASVCIICGIVFLWFLSGELDAIALGHETAHAVGVNLQKVIPVLLIVASFITSASVAVSGLIGFVGLIIPHIIRRYTGPCHRILLPSASLAGGIFLAIADAVARSLLKVQEMPVGIVTAFIGGPFFLWLLYTEKTSVWSHGVK